MAMRAHFHYMMTVPQSESFDIHRWLSETFGPEGLCWTSTYSVLGPDILYWFKREQDLVMTQVRWSYWQ